MKRILLGIGILALIAIGAFSSVNAAGLGSLAGYFGGRVLTYIPPYPPFCWTGYILYYDYAAKVTKAIIPTPATIWYKWYQAFTPGNYIIGQHSPIPVPEGCGITVYPIIKIGTSAAP